MRVSQVAPPAACNSVSKALPIDVDIEAFKEVLRNSLDVISAWLSSRKLILDFSHPPWLAMQVWGARPSSSWRLARFTWKHLLKQSGRRPWQRVDRNNATCFSNDY